MNTLNRAALTLVLATLAVTPGWTHHSFAGEPAEIAPLETRVKAAEYIFTAVAARMTGIRDGKPLKHTPVRGDLYDPVRIELDISEVFLPDSWKDKRHVTIMLYHSQRGNPTLVSDMMGKKLIYLLQKWGDHYSPASDGCLPALPEDQKEK